MSDADIQECIEREMDKRKERAEREGCEFGINNTCGDQIKKILEACCLDPAAVPASSTWSGGADSAADKIKEDAADLLDKILDKLNGK